VPKRLLLVDNEPRNLDLLEGYLSPLGHDIDVAEDGRSALGQFVERQPDLVIISDSMPPFEGIDLLAHVRAHSGTDHIPIILLVPRNEGDPRASAGALDIGADEIVEIPVDPLLLITRVRAMLALKESRDALTARNDGLERLKRRQREIVNFIVHGLKNPLSVALTNIQWVREGLPDGGLAEGLDEADDAVRRIQGMIEDLLSVSRLEESEFLFQSESIAINDLFTDVLGRFRRAADEKKVALHAPSAVGLSVRADRALLRRVLENILDNSLRYTPSHGRVSLVARGRVDVEIAVSNTGPSIPPSDRRRIFEKFERGERESASRGTAGLGLYFCKCAVEALGGKIEVVETPEWPTSFVVHLPTS